MLNPLLRNFSVILVIGVSACSFGSTPVGQGSNNSSASTKRDGGADGVDTSANRRRLSTRTADARVADQADGQDAGEDKTEPEKGDAGGDDRKASGGSSGSGTKPADKGDDKKSDPNQNQNQNPSKPADGGTTTKMMTTTSPVMDAGKPVSDAATDAGNPISNLEELAKMSPSARTTATINKFLTTLSMGDAPASSIKEFLNSINAEVDCKKNPLAYECITACQAVGTTCALCILEDECRMTMLDICGVTALGGCIPRR